MKTAFGQAWPSPARKFFVSVCKACSKGTLLVEFSSRKRVGFRVKKLRVRWTWIMGHRGIQVSAPNSAISIDVKIRLPEEFQELLREVGKRLGVCSSALLLPILSVSADAIGNRVSLETELFPKPVNPSLACVVVGSRSWRIIGALVDPLREERDNCLSALGQARRKELQAEVRRLEREREASVVKDLPRDPESEEYYERKITALQNRLWAPFIAENLSPTFLFKTLARSHSQALLAVYSDPTFQALLNGGVNNAALFELLACGLEGKTPEPALFEDLGSGVIFRPVIGTLAGCEQPTIAGLLSRTEPFMRHFLEHLLIVVPEASPICADSKLVNRNWRQEADEGSAFQKSQKKGNENAPKTRVSKITAVTTRATLSQTLRSRTRQRLIVRR